MNVVSTPWHVCLIALGFLPGLAGANVFLGQVDDFQDSSTAGWTSGSQNPNPPLVALGAGPLGAGDHALAITANGGFGPGGRMIAFNGNQWSGDYLAAGVDTISLDLANLGSEPLQVRLAIEGLTGLFGTTNAVEVPADGVWISHSFDLSPENWTSLGGDDVAASLASVSVMRILHSETPDWRGGIIEGALHVDNITAVPEPASLALLLGGAALVLRRRRVNDGNPIRA